METSLLATLKQQQTLSLDQQQSLRLLQMSANELLNEADLMLEDNPLLERDGEEPAAADESPIREVDGPSDDYAAEGDLSETEKPIDEPFEIWQGASEDDSPFERVAAVTDFREELLAEAGCLPATPLRRLLLTCLIEELDEHGFLTDPLAAVAAEYANIVCEEGFDTVQLSDWEEARDILRNKLDPAGIGAAGPLDALFLQLRRLENADESRRKTAVLLRTMLEKGLLQVARNDRTALRRLAQADESDIDAALSLLKALTPYPITGSATAETQYVVPDILIERHQNRFTARINPATQPALRLRDAAIRERLKTSVGNAACSVYYSDAKAFLLGLEARRKTLLRLAEAVVDYQQDYFAQGACALRPMTLAMIAEQLGLSESTISRAAAGKFLLCAHGTVELRSLFSTAIFRTQKDVDTVEEQSAAQIQTHIRTLIEQENSAKPLTDDAISRALSEKGFNVARRTVAKYREQMNFPSARMRKKF